ncbi:MAG: STAS domain-containing protein [Thalassolituus sp.]
MAEVTNIDCGNRLSIDQAEDLYQKFEAALLAGGDVAVNAESVQYSDTSGLQLLLSLQKTLATTGNSISWAGVSSNVLETAGYLGLSKPLNLPE